MSDGKEGPDSADEQELRIQCEVNTELKRLLVASLGSDLQKELDDLIQTKARLTQQINEQSHEIECLKENLDGANIQADMWHCKYQATRVIVDELSSWKAHTTLRLRDVTDCLSTVLSEHNDLWKLLVQTNEDLESVRRSVDKSKQQTGFTRLCNCLELAEMNSHLSAKVEFKLSGRQQNVSSTSTTIPCYDILLRRPTNIESHAEKVLSTIESDQLLNKSLRRPANERRMLDRFHPQTRYDHLTLNCCSTCQGDLIVV